MVKNNSDFITGETGAYAGVSFYKTSDIQPDATITNIDLANFYLLCNGSGPSRCMAIYRFVGKLTIKIE
ncbi:MAG TPA: hypothetical protein ACHBX0_12810 [Arsenophonus sp.]